jgi:hypothetical protein
MMRTSMKLSDVVGELLGRVPEFAASERGWNRDLPHDACGTFSLFLCKQIHAGGAGEDFLRRSFEILNEMACSDDEDVLNLLVVSVLEVLADDDACRSVAEHYLSTEGRRLLERVASGWLSR